MNKQHAAKMALKSTKVYAAALAAIVAGLSAWPQAIAGQEGTDVPLGIADVIWGGSAQDLQKWQVWAAKAESCAQRGDLDAAGMHYRAILNAKPPASVAATALFNLGWLAEELGVEDEAVVAYQRLLGVSQQVDFLEETRVRAHLRLAILATRTGQAWEAVSHFDAVLAAPLWEIGQRLEALVGRGIALELAANSSAAESAYTKALIEYRKLPAGSHMRLAEMAAEAAYRLAQLIAKRFEKAPLYFDGEETHTSLVAKCALLLSAQGRFVQAMRLGDAQTVAMAGLAIGGLYERLHRDVLKLEIPSHLRPKAKEAYLDALHGRIQILLKKAERIYRKAEDASERVGANPAWIAKLHRAWQKLARPTRPEESGLKRSPPTKPSTIVEDER